jgi:hypothetical protein
MSSTEKDRDTYTVIAGRAYPFLECVIRFERSAGAGTVWFIDGTCKRVALEDDQAPRSDVTLVGDPYAEHRTERDGRYQLYDARTVVDTDGEEWILTELGLNCPRCCEHQRDLYRIMERTGTNPFTNQLFVRFELSDEFQTEADFVHGVLEGEGLGRPLAINESVRSAAIARSARDSSRRA